MSEQKNAETLNKIDITQWTDRFMHSLKKLWWLIILLTIACAAINYSRVSSSYVPVYTAEATLTISSTSEGQALGSDSYTNVTKAGELQDIFASVVSSGILNDIIAEDLGLSYVPGSYNVTQIADTNMITVTATARDGQMAYDILQAVIKDYPDVCQYIVGQTYAVVLDDSGVPEDTGREYTIRGSQKKGAIIGFLIGMLILFADVMLQRTVRYESDFNAFLHTPCLGIVPELKIKKRKRGKQKEISILSDNISYNYLESIRSLRSRVERKMEKTGQKTLMVTSSVPSEGKSTLAANLAVAFGRKGKRVCLVDCDLRHPSLKEKLGITGDYVGLEAILTGGEDDAREIFYKVPGMEVYVICGVDKPSKNTDILGGENMAALIKDLEDFADVVILDTSPSAVLADAITLAKNCPLALYVVRCDYVKIRSVLDGIQELSETGINVLGCALNYGHSSSSKHTSGYGYGKYGYGYKYGKSSYGRSETTGGNSHNHSEK